MLRRLKNLIGIEKPAVLPEGPPPPARVNVAPEHRIYAIGDVHGELELLEQALARIEKHMEQHAADTPMQEAKIVVLGDLVDRGQQSAQVLERVHDLTTQAPDKFVAILGNHEVMMMEFIDDPLGRGARWLRFGGADTLKSFGIAGDFAAEDPDVVMQASAHLEQRIKITLLPWLKTLPMTFQSGNVWCAHAAMNPAEAPEDQSHRSLLWGHPDFMTTGRSDDIWVVHGHTIVSTPECRDSRISVDTGAYKTGQLSVAAITDGLCEFL